MYDKFSMFLSWIHKIYFSFVVPALKKAQGGMTYAEVEAEAEEEEKTRAAKFSGAKLPDDGN